MPNIESMTTDQWLAYREQRIDNFYARGNELKPNPQCSNCDSENDYVCFGCELTQLDSLTEAK